MNHLETITCQLAVQVWLVGFSISPSERRGLLFFKLCFYTNLGRLPFWICDCLKVYSIQLTAIRAVPWVWFRTMQNGWGAWRMLSLEISIHWQSFSYNNTFSEPASPRQIWERTKNLKIANFRSRRPRAFPNDNRCLGIRLQWDTNFMVRSKPWIDSRILEYSESSCSITWNPWTVFSVFSNTDYIESIVNSTKFNKEQQTVFNTILGEILPGVTTDNPEAPIQRLFNRYELRPPAYFLDAPADTGKNI